MDKILDELKKQEITRQVRGLAVKHLQMGVSVGTLVICRSCGYAKPIIGATCYGKYRLCNDCALSYELARAEGKINDIESFIQQQKPERRQEKTRSG